MFKLTFMILFFVNICFAKTLSTNETNFINAPSWLDEVRVESVTNLIQDQLEWTTRKINVSYYASQNSFNKLHSFGSKAVAVTIHKKHKSEIKLGPKVTTKNFNGIFGHELVHVIIRQKYKTSIPKWLEEGLANHLSKSRKVDYKWLAKQKFPEKVQDLSHPFKGDLSRVGYRYRASQALAEMLDKKCGLENLIRLSVQRKMENYIKSYCEIKDLNQEFRKWVKSNS